MPCATRNSNFCHTLKVTRRRPAPLRPFSHSLTNWPAAVRCKRRSRQCRPPMAANGRRHARPARGRMQAIRRLSDGEDPSPSRATRRQPGVPGRLPAGKAAGAQSGHPWGMGSACRPRPAAASGLPPWRAPQPRMAMAGVAPPWRPRKQTRSPDEDHIRYSTLRCSCAARLAAKLGLTGSGKRMSGCTV